MPNYRRPYVPGATFFFTVVTNERRTFLTDPISRHCLRQAFVEVRRDWPFTIVAIVLLPDHLHTLWTQPENDGDYSVRWRRIKEHYPESYLSQGGKEGYRSPSRVRRKERGVWQRRFWDHLIRDETDLERHFDYTHYNPVKHGYVTSPADWPYSSFHRYVQAGFYAPSWGSAPEASFQFDDLDESAME